MCVADDFSGGQSFSGIFQRNQNASPLLGTLDVSRLTKDCPAARFLAE